jgi:hypothetical protein
MKFELNVYSLGCDQEDHRDLTRYCHNIRKAIVNDIASRWHLNQLTWALARHLSAKELDQIARDK